MRVATLRRGALLLALAAGCSPRGAGEGPRAKEEAKGSTKAVAAVEGAFCKEHGVLEAVCTRCNPKLVPVFKAKGDWCSEHDFPESICPICHPERGGKPAADVSSDGAPSDGMKVKLRTGDTARLAGITTARAVARQGGGGIPVIATIVYDATRVAEINARSAGVVRALKVDVGSQVKAGGALAIIDSAEVGADRSKLTGASSRVKVAGENLEREKQLEREGVGTHRSVLAAQQELDAAKAEVASLAAALSVVGANAGGAGGYTLTTPLSGVVTQRSASIGKLVATSDRLFEVVDTRAMWAELDVPETDLPDVKLEQSVVLQIEGIAGRDLAGTISYLAPSVDPHTRTVKARVQIANPDGALRANMYGRARILAESRQGVMVPREAVQRAKSVQLVFVKLAADQFEARRVEIGAGDGDLVEVLKGVRVGEEVATQGSFLLKTETLKESIGAGCCAGD
ncbi:MAG: efflux RND transporter periplasmic adaptor subunit [Byssovorax sp.]